MEEYRRKQQQRHAEWKQQQEEETQRKQEETQRKQEETQRKQEETQRKQQLLAEQKAKSDFLDQESTAWMKEGYEWEDSRIIAAELYQTHLMLQNPTLQFIHPVNSVPKLFGVCALAGPNYYFFDLRLLMDQWELMFWVTPGQPSNRPPPVLFRTGFAVDPSFWSGLQEYWKVINPYQHLVYKTRPYRLRVKTVEKEPHTDVELQAYMDRLTSDQPISHPFEQDDKLGAFSVALPASIVGLLLNESDDGRNYSRDPLAVELCVPGMSPRVYAYCRNPDECSHPKTVQLPWRLKYLLKAFEDQEVHVRVLVAPSIPRGHQLPALRVMTVSHIPEDVSEGALRTALNQSLNHQRVVFPGQVILAYVPHVYGPIPFLVAQTYMTHQGHSRLPSAVVGIYGHGDGMDCVIETQCIPSTVAGFEKYFTYLFNLKRRAECLLLMTEGKETMDVEEQHQSQSQSTQPRPSNAVVAQSIRDQLFAK